AVAGPHADIDERDGTGQGIGAILLPGIIAEQSVTLEAQGRARAESLGLTTVQFDEVAISGLHGGPRISLCGEALFYSGFGDLVKSVEGEVLDPRGLVAARPGDFDAIDLLAIAQAEMERPGRLRQVAAGRLHLPHQNLIADVQFDPGTNGVAVALGSGQAEG